MSKIFETKENNKERQYIINLNKRRSLIAMFASFISMFFAIYAIVSGLILYAKDGVEPINLFQYFTIDANVFMLLGVVMILPYTIEGFRKKRFYCPKWVVYFYYSGVTCTTLIMLFAVFIISTVDPKNAFYGNNFYLHIVCPIMILIAFFLIESYYKISMKISIMCILPVLIYAIVYIIEVIIIGEKAGGWEDIYYFTKNATPIVSFCIMMLMAFAVAVLIAYIYNKISDIRIKKLVGNLWDDSVSEVEINIEVFGLGRFMGKKENKSYSTLPLDIIFIIADKFHMDKEKLIRVYVKGMLDGINEKKDI